MYGMPLNDTKLLENTIRNLPKKTQQNLLNIGEIVKDFVKYQVKPSFWQGEFDIKCENGEGANDTFLRLDGWTKGVAFVNGFNLGRYWPVMGPQVKYKLFLDS